MLLSLDVSITSTGYVVFSRDKTIEVYGCIKTDNKLTIYERLSYIETELENILSNLPITNVTIEAPAYGARGAMSYNLFGIHFSVVRLMFKHGLQYKLMNIASVKKFATDNGRASKVEMLEALPTTIRDSFISCGFKKSTGLYDLTDAYFIGLKYLNEN